MIKHGTPSTAKVGNGVHIQKHLQSHDSKETQHQNKGKVKQKKQQTYGGDNFCL